MTYMSVVVAILAKSHRNISKNTKKIPSTNQAAAPEEVSVSKTFELSTAFPSQGRRSVQYFVKISSFSSSQP